MTSPGRVMHWVVALKPEAQPLIEALQLRHDGELSGGGFQVYGDERGSHRLILSGIGKVNAAAATARLWSITGKDAVSGWINFGVAGMGRAEIGSVFRANKVTDEATGRSWFPRAVSKRSRKRWGAAEVLTVDRPLSDFPSPSCLVEMEASGFLATACRFSSLELIQVVKTVSDNQDRGFQELTPGRIREICSSAIPSLLEMAAEGNDLLVEEEARLAGPPGVGEILERFHFTESEKHLFRKRVRRALVLEKFDRVDAWIDREKPRTGKEILRSLEGLLADTEGAED